MLIELTDLLIFFDELLPATNEELKSYWFQSTRADGISIIFAASVYNESVGVILKAQQLSLCSIHLENCLEIRVLDDKKKCLEVLHKNGVGRCFLSLLDDSILSYEGRCCVIP